MADGAVAEVVRVSRLSDRALIALDRYLQARRERDEASSAFKRKQAEIVVERAVHELVTIIYTERDLAV